MASKITTEELEWVSKSRNVEMNVRRMGRKETNNADFSIAPFLPTTGIEKKKEKKKRRKPLAEKGKKVHHSIKIHWDELNKKEYKTLPGKMLHGRNAYY